MLVNTYKRSLSKSRESFTSAEMIFGGGDTAEAWFFSLLCDWSLRIGHSFLRRPHKRLAGFSSIVSSCVSLHKIERISHRIESNRTPKQSNGDAGHGRFV